MDIQDSVCVGMRAPRRELVAGELSLCLPVQGCWRLRKWRMTAQELSAHLSYLIDELGVTSFDHADIYGDYECEKLFGDALKRSLPNRHQIELIGKCGIRAVSDKYPDHRFDHYDTRKDHILDAVENSLTQLGTDYLDLLLIHRPDPLMRVEDVAEAFDVLHQQGKVRFFGVSNFSPPQWQNLAAVCSHPLICNQFECSLLHMDSLLDGSYDELLGDGLVPLFWSPLAGGKMLDGRDERAATVLPLLAQIGDQLDLEVAGVALAWLAGLPGAAVPVLGTGNRERLCQAIRALQTKLDRQDWYALWEAATGKPLP